MSAAGGWGLAIDNVSSIPDWWSDALCKAVTGDAWIDRRLYTDDELAILAFKRVIMLTSIDAGSLRDDLGDRLILLDLSPIPEAGRRPEAELNRLFANFQPLILGALLDVLADVLERLPDVQLSTMPRMADFAQVLAALDFVIGARGGGNECHALPLYLSQRNRIASEVVEGDPLATDIVRFLSEVRSWQGTAAELLTMITPRGRRPEAGWPKAPNKLTGQLKRLTPALRTFGVIVSIPSFRSARGRLITMEMTDKREIGSSLSSPSSQRRELESSKGDDPSFDDDGQSTTNSEGAGRSDDSDDQCVIPCLTTAGCRNSEMHTG